jgi:hypothetical protein
MGASIIAFLIFAFTGLLFLVAGHRIKYKKDLTLIAGYDPDRIRDKEGLANQAGLFVMGLGGASIFTGLFMTLAPEFIPVVIVLYTRISMILTGAMLSSVRRFTD